MLEQDCCRLGAYHTPSQQLKALKEQKPAQSEEMAFDIDTKWHLSSIPWGDIGQDSELPATPYKDGRKVTKPE